MDNKVILQKVDLKYLNWSKTRKSSGTAGSFLKAQETVKGKKTYYKLSNYEQGKGIVGHECVNEIIADRLLTILGIPHLSYRLIYADISIDGKIYDTYLCESEDFKNKNEEKMAFDLFYDSKKESENESKMDFCNRFGWSQYVYEMLIADFLILNRDRHGANIEVLRDKKTKKIRLAPLFDHGLSLLWSCRTDEQALAYDVMNDARVQCFVASESAYDNIRIIPQDKHPKINDLKESDMDIIFEDLDKVVSPILIGKLKEMIWKRWKCYENLRNQKQH